jgi:drug/metabolite transporter (DMT)-like permease
MSDAREEEEQRGRSEQPGAGGHPHHAGASMGAGGLLALVSAVAFGASTPFVQRSGRGIGPFTTAALLYGGAALFSALRLVRRQPTRPGDRRGRANLKAGDLPRLAVVAALGAVVAPVALAWGLQRTSGVGASLLLNLEAVFTVLLARALWAEPIGPRVGIALVAMTGGGALLVAGVVVGDASLPPAGVGAASAVAAGAGAGVASAWGALAVIGATLAWAADNSVGRPLSDREPTSVVLAKGALGAAASSALAVASGEGLPSGRAAFALAACGAIGYGASLTLYLRAQRQIGAARTGSIFAAAPFVGAAIAWGLGQRPAGPSTLVACALFAAGLWLHLTEHHDHEHTHEAIAHDHTHSHEDPHHDHVHEAPPEGEHTHAHRHERMSHAHPHGLDVHHRHPH